jgi:hypothetical protein
MQTVSCGNLGSAYRLDSKGFLRWCITLRITGFLDLSVVRYFKNQRTQRFGNWICFRLQVMGETPAPLGSLGKVNLNHSSEDGNRSSFRNVLFSVIEVHFMNIMPSTCRPFKTFNLIRVSDEKLLVNTYLKQKHEKLTLYLRDVAS